LTRTIQERVVAIAKGKGLTTVVLHEHPYSKPLIQADANLCGVDGASAVTQILEQLLRSMDAHCAQKVLRRRGAVRSC